MSVSNQSFSIHKTISKVMRIREFPLLVFILLGCVFLSIQSPAFLQRANFLSLARGFSIEGVILIGMTMLLVSGVFDISVGSVMALAGDICAMLLAANTPLPLAILGGLSVGGLCGTINGVVIARFKVNPFIATFGMLAIARSVGLAITHGYPIVVSNKVFTFLGIGLVGGIPASFIILIILTILADFAMRKVRFFRQLYFIGGNESGAKLIGINISKVRIISYIFVGLMAGLSGVLSSARLSGATPNAYSGIELKLIVAAVVGGCTLNGGVGTIAGSMLGLVFLFLLSNSMTLLGVNMYWEPFVLGVFLVLVVLYNMYAPTRLIANKKPLDSNPKIGEGGT